LTSTLTGDDGAVPTLKQNAALDRVLAVGS
jgi:hypothetical protein